MQTTYIIIAVGFAALMLTEILISKEKKLNLHDPIDSVISLSLGIFGVVLRAAFLLGPTLLLYTWLFQYAPFKFEHTWYAWFLCFWVNEFIYYWFHRWGHEVRWLWATHVNHHSSRYMNFFTAARTPFMNGIHHAIFWIPAPLLGFPPDMILTVESFGFLYAFLQHTEIIPKLGFLEWFLATPSHHRVHHGSNPQYIDKNYGGVVIVFDRLFGTFEPEVEKVRYGITKPIKSHNWLDVVFHEWRDMFMDIKNASSLKDKLTYFFGRTGWKPSQKDAAQ